MMSIKDMEVVTNVYLSTEDEIIRAITKRFKNVTDVHIYVDETGKILADITSIVFEKGELIHV
jgi:hypothetical protein